MPGYSPHYLEHHSEAGRRERERQLVRRAVLALTLFAAGMVAGLGLAYLLPTLEVAGLFEVKIDPPGMWRYP